MRTYLLRGLGLFHLGYTYVYKDFLGEGEKGTKVSERGFSNQERFQVSLAIMIKDEEY